MTSDRDAIVHRLRAELWRHRAALLEDEDPDACIAIAEGFERLAGLIEAEVQGPAGGQGQMPTFYAPEHYIFVEQLRDGTAVTLRAARADDGPKIRRAIRNLDPQTAQPSPKARIRRVAIAASACCAA